MDTSFDEDMAPLRGGSAAPAASVTERRVSRSLEQEAPEASPRRSGISAIWTLPALAFGGVSLLLLAYLCQSAQIVRAQYRIVAVRGEVRELQAEAADLELSMCELTALERVERLATQRLAMAVPTQRKVIEVSWQKALEKGSEVAALR